MIPLVGRRVVVLNPDGATAQHMADYLSAHGFVSRACTSVDALLAELPHASPCLVLLDGGADVTDRAVEIVRDVHAVSPVPCMLRASAHSSEVQRVHGLENGLDDWIPAGTRPREIVARIRAVLRRALKAQTAPSAERQEPFGMRSPPRTWRLSPERRDLFTPSGEACGLTSAEFDLIYTLARNQRTAVARESLSQAVFRRAWCPDDRSIDNLVMRLKRKLATHSRTRDMIKPVRGVGYVFTGF